MTIITEEEYNKLRNYEENKNLLCTMERINAMMKDEDVIEAINQLQKIDEEESIWTKH